MTLCASTRSQAKSSTVGTTCNRYVAITPANLRDLWCDVIVGEGCLWITEYVITYEGKRAYTVSIMEFRDGKVSHETQYFADPFDAPAWRAQWVERVHQWGAHEHPPLVSPSRSGPGNGLLLFFRVDDFDEALLRAHTLVAALAEEPHVNPNTGTKEFALCDHDGYYVMISALSAA
jgi:hypothetical protein